jgi:hypothetical protein
MMRGRAALHSVLALLALLALLGASLRLEAAPAVRYQARSWLYRALNGGAAPEILSVRLPHQAAMTAPLSPTAPRTRFRRFVYERKGALRGLRKAIVGGKATVLELEGASFLGQLEKGATYNLVVVGDELLLAKTGSGFFRDLVSRHAVLTDYAPADFAATIRKLDDGSLELANWSGTFMTPSSMLPAAATRLRQGLGIERIVIRPVDKKGVLSATPPP